MLGLLALFYIGNTFFTLADTHHKSNWGFAFAGIGVFYGAQIIMGTIIAIFYMDALESSTITINVGGLFIGAIAAVVFYTYLKNKWENAIEVPVNPDILDDHLL